MGNHPEISGALVPEASILPDATSASKVVFPVASLNQVRGSVSTTLGGVPRVCRGPSMHCTATNGGDPDFHAVARCILCESTGGESGGLCQLLSTWLFMIIRINDPRDDGLDCGAGGVGVDLHEPHDSPTR